MTRPFRCAAASADRGEPLPGTASTVRAFLLVEAPGPWGVDAVSGNRLPDQVKRHLAEAPAQHGVRPLMIRRHGRSDPDQLTVFAAYADATTAWVETTCVADPLSLRDVDLQSLGAGRSPGLVRHTEPLFLVCTHGRHDACCAEQGRPVASALSRAEPEATWEVSHIGGDRFAGNMLVLPEGLYYGRLSPDDAVETAAAHRAGHLALDHLRGRSSLPFAAQAAECHLRAQIGDLDVDSLRVTSLRRSDAVTTVVFGRGSGAWRVRVRSGAAPRERLTCHALRDGAPTEHTLLSITPVDAANAPVTTHPGETR